MINLIVRQIHCVVFFLSGLKKSFLDVSRGLESESNIQKGRFGRGGGVRDGSADRQLGNSPKYPKVPYIHTVECRFVGTGFNKLANGLLRPMMYVKFFRVSSKHPPQKCTTPLPLTPKIPYHLTGPPSILVIPPKKIGYFDLTASQAHQFFGFIDVSEDLKKMGQRPGPLHRAPGSVLIDDSQTPPPPQKCPFSEIDFLDVSDDFKQKKNPL